MKTVTDFFDIDETVDDSGASAQAGGLYADAARDILHEGVRKLMRQALRWHQRDIKERTRRAAYRIWKKQRENETVEQWRERLAKLKWKETDVPPAPHSAIGITTGVGKSTELRYATAGDYIPAAQLIALAAQQAFGPPFIIAEQPPPHRVLIGVPTHELAFEADRKMPDGIKTAIYQGLKAFKLGTDKEPMCLNHPAVDAALECGADVQKTACRRGQRGGPPILCPFYGECHYQKMLAECAKVDVVFVAHEVLFKLPAALGEFGLVIIDEGFWQTGLTGTDAAHPVRLCIEGLARELTDFPVNETIEQDGRRMRVKSERKTQELREMLETLQYALAGEADGYVRRDAIAHTSGLNLSPHGIREACQMEWDRKVDHGLKPDADQVQRDAAVKQYGFLAQIKRRVEMWKAIGDLLCSDEDATGHLVIKTETTAEGSVRYLEIMGRKAIDGRLMRLPIIHADATLQFELSKFYLPRLKLAVDLKVDAPHARTTQIIGMAVGKSSLQVLAPGKRTPEKEEEVAEKRKRLVATVRELVAGRRGLVITYLAIEDDFKGSNNIEVAHHGAIEGIDRWGDVEVLVVIGRLLPWKKALARLAAALTGKPVVTDTVKQERMVGGSKVQVWTCTDSDAELVRVGITEAAVAQAHGRVRAVNRTAANPVEIYLILHDTVVPDLKIDEVVKFQKIEPGAYEEMLARGWRLESPKDAHRLFPDLFPSPEAAKKAYQRSRSKVHRGTSLYKYVFIKACPSVRDIRLRYGRRGMRQRPWLAWVDPSKVPDPRTVLETAFGEKLALFEILEAGAEAKPSPGRKRKRKPKLKPVAAVDPVAEPIKHGGFDGSLTVVGG